MSAEITNQANVVQRIEEAYTSKSPDQRLMVAIAGAPASGKSRLAERITNAINEHLPDINPAVVVPMDGFHLDNAILDERGLRAVKGAPDTFDVAGLHQLLQRLAAPVTASSDSDADKGWSIYVPLFDRSLDLTRCAACEVKKQHRIVIVEGNYLLLQRKGWRELASLFDLSLMLEVPHDILEQRLIKRWMDNGMNREAAQERALSNDLRNALIVTGESISADLLLKSVRQ